MANNIGARICPICNPSDGALIKLLLVHALALVVVQLAIGCCRTFTYQPHAFASLGFVMALKATLVLLLLAAIVNTWIGEKRRTAAGTTWRGRQRASG